MSPPARMRVALIVPGFSAEERDWCIPALLNLVRGLAQRHEVVVFTLRYPHRQGWYEVAGAQVLAFGGAQVGGVRRGPLLARALASILRVGRARPFAVVHGIWADEPGALAVAAGRLLGVPSVVSLFGGELVGLRELGYGHQLSRVNRWLVRGALRGATRVTVGSAYLGALAMALVPPLAPLAFPLGVDTALFSPSGERAALRGNPVLLQVGSLVPVKDQATLLHAFARVVVAHPAAALHLVGEGPLREALAHLAEALGVAEQVIFHGAVAHHRLPAFYRAADLHVLSSRYESQNLALLEAAACGTPSVGTAVGILPELVPPTWLAPVGDGERLGAKVLALVGDAGQRRAQGHTMQVRVQQEFTLRRMQARLEDLYHSLRVGEGHR